MIKRLFFKEGRKNKTGVYKIEHEKLIELEEIPGNGSINSIIESLNYPLNHIYIVHLFIYNSKKIHSIGFKVFSKNPIFVLAKDKNTKLTLSDVNKEVDLINWKFEYSSLNIENILNDAIELQNMSLEFLQSVIELSLYLNDIYLSEKFGLYFMFENNILKAFNSSGWDNSATKWLKNLNFQMYERILNESRLYHNEIWNIMEEVNIQSKSLLAIPHAVNNEFIGLHEKESGNINFYNLLITHYAKECYIDEFLFINKGRCSIISENSFKAGNFVYEFVSNKLVNVYKK